MNTITVDDVKWDKTISNGRVPAISTLSKIPSA